MASSVTDREGVRVCDEVGMEAAEVEACETSSLESASATAATWRGASVDRMPDPDRVCEKEPEERFLAMRACFAR